MRVSNGDLDCVRYLGSLNNIGMMLARHVNHISDVCFLQLRQMRITRRYLTVDVAQALVRALIHTRIDYCNGHLDSCPRYLTNRYIVNRARPPGWYCNYSTYQLCRKSYIGSCCSCGMWTGWTTNWSPRIKMPPLSSSQLPIRTVHSGFNFRRSRQHALILEVRPTILYYVSRTKTKILDLRGSSSAVWNLHPVDLRDSGLSRHSFRTKLKSHFFTVDCFVSFVHSRTLLLCPPT